MEKIVLVGAGGHCKVIIDIIRSCNKYQIAGITDADFGKVKEISNVRILGNDDILYDLFKKGIKNAFVCIGALNNPNLRYDIFTKLKKIGFNIPVLIHNSSIISDNAYLGEGTCVMPGAVVNSGAIIKENCIINTSSVVEHDCFIDYNTHISPNACICGGVKVGHNCHIGAGSTVIQGINIGNNTVIGAGAVVVSNLSDNVIAVGIPSKVIKCR